MKITSNTIVGFLACGLSIAGGRIMAAQEMQLNRIGLRLSTNGYETTHQTTRGSLNEGQAATFSLWLQGGTEYSVRGTCDSDCTDLDLELRSPIGSIVDRDVDPDDVPVVSTRPNRSGWYQVRVVMAGCSVRPCRYAVGVFGR